MATGGEQADRRLPDDKFRYNAMILRSEVDRNQQPLDYALTIRRNDSEESSGMESEVPIDGDWLDEAPLEAIKNDYTIDLEILGLRKREPREDNRKRKLCYSPYADDGYGLSKRTYRRLRNKQRQIRGRGKRFKKDDSMNIDEPIVVLPSDAVPGGQYAASSIAASPTTSQTNCLSDVEVSGSYVSDEEAVRDEEEMDEEDEEEMEANLPDELMNQIEYNLHFGE